MTATEALFDQAGGVELNYRSMGLRRYRPGTATMMCESPLAGSLSFRDNDMNTCVLSSPRPSFTPPIIGTAVMFPTESHRRGVELLRHAEQFDTLDLTVFMPCRDEQGNVSRALNEVVETLCLYAYSYEIIVVDDASCDRSVEEISAFIASHPAIPITLKCNSYALGVSRNLTDAAIMGRGRHFIFIGSAFQNRRDSMEPVFDQLGNADVILTPMKPDERTPLRRLLSRLYTMSVNLVSGYDIAHYHGTPLFRRIDVVRWHSYRSQGFYADMITRLLDEGISYIEVATPCHEREKGRSRALRMRNLISVGVGLGEMLVRRFSRERVPPQRLPPADHRHS